MPQYFHTICKADETEIWRRCGKSVESAEKDVSYLKIWIKSQLHLPQNLTHNQLKCFLLINKGSVEKTKRKIDMYFTARTLYPQLFTNTSPTSRTMVNAARVLYAVPLPKLTSQLHRIIVFKVKNVNPVDMDPAACFAYILNMVEIRLLEDFCDDHLVIMDLEYCKLGHITKITPMFIKTAYTVCDRVLTTRTVAIHLINAPAFLDQLMFVIKSIVKPKLANKFHIHKDMESVIATIDKDVLPRDFGGNEEPLDVLESKWLQKYEQYKDFFEKREKSRVNEQLRPIESLNDDILGYQGNFKSLEVD